MFARQAMGEFMQRDNPQQNKPGDQQRFEMEQAAEFASNLRPMNHADVDRNHHERRRQRHKMRREEKANFGQKPVKETVRIEGFEAKIEQVARDPAGRRCWSGQCCRVEQAKATEPFDESIQGRLRQRRVEPGLHLLSNGFRVGRAGQLFEDEALYLPETEVASRLRVFHDKANRSLGFLAAEDQIASQFCRRA